MQAKRAQAKRAVLVTTIYKGVFYGRTDDGSSATVITLEDARCAIYMGVTGGFLQLAATGPTAASKIGARAPKITLQGVSSVVELTPEAIAAWEAA